MRQPAYAKALQDAIRRGQEPVHGIAVWLDQAPPERPLFAPLACFSDTDPAAVDWSLCRGRDCVVPMADRCAAERLRALVLALQAAQPRRLQLWHSRGAAVRFVVTAEAEASEC